MKHIVLLVGLLIALAQSLVFAGGMPVPIVDPSVSLPSLTGKTQTAQDVRAYILASGATLKSGTIAMPMVVDSDEPGLLKLTFNKQNKHFFTITVNYDASSYQIKYVQSENLDYRDEDGVRKIHRNYPIWIQSLVNGIAAAQLASPSN
ncbi:hypothetical protein [Chitinolyticbacter meiyuanensis]|uniref:hypothetical protein n=1 Tax=Chitinolyticbacter meiyuanensis TaxID=682798 RepID=UPI0011E5CF4B|nr:hypothetical protein [Chitinolyticbacter meiyuanensis]